LKKNLNVVKIVEAIENSKILWLALLSNRLRAAAAFSRKKLAESSDYSSDTDEKEKT